MPVFCECEFCGKKYKLSDDRAGTTIVCKECDGDIEVPALRGQGRRRSASSSSRSSSQNGLVIGLAIAVVLLVGVLLSVVFVGRAKPPEIAQQPVAPMAADDPKPLPVATPVQTPQPVSTPTVPLSPRQVSSSAAESDAGAARTLPPAPRRVNSTSSMDEVKKQAKLSLPTPPVIAVSTAPFVGANGMGVRVPSACVIQDIKTTDKELSFKVLIPGQPVGSLEFEVEQNPQYTAASSIDVVTQRGPLNYAGRGTVIFAPGGTVERVLVDRINFWLVKLPEDDGGLYVRMMGFDTGLQVSLKWKSPQNENGNISRVLNAIARTFSRSARSAKFPEDDSSPTSTAPAFAANPSKEPQPAAVAAKPIAASAAAWGSGSLLNIPMENWATLVKYSPAPSRLALVGNIIYSLESGEPVLTLPNSTIREAAFSPEGKWFAVFSDGGTPWEGHVVLYPIGQPGAEAVELVLDDQPHRYEVLRFLSESRLLVYGRNSNSRTTAIWNLDTLKIERRLPTGDIDQGSCAATKDGMFFAVASATELKVLNTQTGREVAHMAAPTKTTGLPFAFCNGLAFSPDMSELAAFVHGKNFTVWSNRGKIVLEHELSQSLDASAESENTITWLPDGTGWLLQGRMLLLKDGLTEAWQLKSKPPYQSVPSTLIANNRVVAAHGSSNKGLLVDVEIPFNAIRSARDAFNKVPPLLNEGESLTLDLKISDVRLSTEAEVRGALTKAFADRLQRGKVGIAAGKPVVLKATYSEKPGKQCRVVNGPFGVLGGNKDGVMVQDTECSLEVSLLAPGRSEPVCSHRFTSDAGLILNEEANEAGLRKSSFGKLLIRIANLDLPLRLSGDPNTSLPVITDVGDQ